MINSPLTSVEAPIEVPSTTTFAPINGPPDDLSVTVPFTFPDWALIVRKGNTTASNTKKEKNTNKPEKRKNLLKTDVDGKFFVGIKLHEDDVLFADEIGYHPGVFYIYQYLKDSKVLDLRENKTQYLPDLIGNLSNFSWLDCLN